MSRTVDLHSEYTAFVSAVTRRLLARLSKLGFVRPAHRIGLVGFARIEKSGGYFEPNSDGVPVLILPVVDGPTMSVPVTLAEDPSRLIDLVAWHPAKPCELAVRVGNAFALGEEKVREALLSGTPLRVFRDPQRWADANADGSVIVQWGAADDLLQASSIIADDIDHGAEVQRQLKILRSRILRRVPRVRVPADSVA